MSGGLLELVAHGVQDSYMIGNPQITFFKIVFKRHTNFSLESVQATFDGTADFGQRIVVTIPRNGDLVNTIVLEADLPAITTDSDAVGKEGTINYVNGLGHVLIEYVELELFRKIKDYESIKQFIDSNKCYKILTSGKNIGNQCSKKHLTDSNYCKIHASSSVDHNLE